MAKVRARDGQHQHYFTYFHTGTFFCNYFSNFSCLALWKILVVCSECRGRALAARQLLT